VRSREENIISPQEQLQLRQGIALARAGKNLEARSILGRVVKSNPQLVLGWLWLANVVETDEQRFYCFERILQLDPQNAAARRGLAQMKAAQSSRAPDSQTSVEQPLISGHADNLGEVVNAVFGPLGYEPYYTGKGIDMALEGQTLLLSVCQEIFTASFGVFNLSSQNPDSYLELGIALGLNRPIIAIAREGESLPPMLAGHQVITYTDHADLETRLARLRDGGFPPTLQPTTDYCYFCGRICESMSVPPDENAYLVLHHSRLLWRGLMQSLTPHLAEYHLYPVYLGEHVSGPMLCDVRRKVLAAQFVLCHLGTLSDESSFLSLGMAIGSRVPWVLLSRKGQGVAPSSLRGIDRIEYDTPADLEEPLLNILGGFLSRIMADSMVSDNKTALLSLPFWVQLQDWINRAMQATQAPEALPPQGRIRVVRYEDSKRFSEHPIPERGLLVGRAPDCDVVLENQSVSGHHFRILKGRTGKTFVEDLQSKNGTFLNGTRLAAGDKVELHPNDTIRIPGARFLIWDDRPLPEAEPAATYGDTGLLSPIPQIEIPEIPPPTYLSTWNHPVVLTVLLPDGHHHSMFEVQAYYPLGKILARLVRLLDLPDQKYRFMLEDKLIDDEETPLSIGIGRGDVLAIVEEE